MGVYNPTGRTEAELGEDLAYQKKWQKGSPAQQLHIDAIVAEINYRDNPSPENTQRHIEILRQLGLHEVEPGGDEWSWRKGRAGGRA